MGNFKIGAVSRQEKTELSFHHTTMDCCDCDDGPVTKRRIQVCHNNERSILSFYWEKLAKENDELLLAYIIKATKNEKEVTEKKEKIMNAVEPFVEQCKEKGITCQYAFHQAKPGEGICEIVKQEKPHLVVMGSRGLNKLQRTIQTSVSEYVMQNSIAPVLIVPVKK